MQNDVQTGTELKTEARTTFDIPVYNLPTLEIKVAKLNKRGVKLGCDPNGEKSTTITYPKFM